MFCSKVLFLAVVVVCFENISTHVSLSTEEKAAIKAQGEPYVQECAKEFSYNDEQVEKLKEHKFHDVDPCFASCFFKKTGLIDSKGIYKVDKALELTKAFIKNPETLAVVQKIKEDCEKVNDEEVADGEKGCDRATLLMKCFQAHKDQFDMEKE